MHYIISKLLEELIEAAGFSGAGNLLYFSSTQGNSSRWVTICAVTQNTDIFFLKKKKHKVNGMNLHILPLLTHLCYHCLFCKKKEGIFHCMAEACA